MKKRRHQNCICGSGRKYKTCCLTADLAAIAEPEQKAPAAEEHPEENYAEEVYTYISNNNNDDLFPAELLPSVQRDRRRREPFFYHHHRRHGDVIDGDRTPEEKLPTGWPGR